MKKAEFDARSSEQVLMVEAIIKASQNSEYWDEIETIVKSAAWDRRSEIQKQHKG